jgi:hypothetical protein
MSRIEVNGGIVAYDDNNRHKFLLDRDGGSFLDLHHLQETLVENGRRRGWLPNDKI